MSSFLWDSQMNADNILVRGVNWVGDAVMTLPTLETIKKGHKGCRLTILTKPTLSAIYEGSPFVDSIIEYEKRHRGVFGKIALSLRLRKGRFSKAYLLQNAFDAALLAFLAGVPHRIGYDRDARGWLLSSAVPYCGEDRAIHHIDYFLKIPVFDGLRPTHKEPWIYLSHSERLQARKRLAQLTRPILGMSPGAAYGETKRWLPERFMDLSRWFVTNTGGSVVLFGESINDKTLYEIEKAIPLNKLSLAGQTTLRELIALISECDVFLGNDSGPMHIARAVKTPTVSLFFSTDPKLTGYSGEGFLSMKSKVSCSPCFQRTCPRGDLLCLSDIGADEVFFEITRRLPKKKAVFFDRDGTLCVDVNYLNCWDDFKPFKDLTEIKRLKDLGYLIIGVTNQSGIARGIIDEGFVREVNRLFCTHYHFDDFFYCPHHPEDGCYCRKPSPGLLLDARLKYNIDLKNSYLVGDRPSDILTAQAVGAKGILIGDKDDCNADYTVRTLKEAVDVIVVNSKKDD